MTGTKDVIDAVVEGLRHSLGDGLELAGAPKLWRYVEPWWVSPERAPVLAVYVPGVNWQPVSTLGDYTTQPTVVVDYIADAARGMETTGAYHDDIAREELERALKIETALAGLYPGLPDPLEGSSATVRDAQYGLISARGMWRARWHLDVDVL